MSLTTSRYSGTQQPPSLHNLSLINQLQAFDSFIKDKQGQQAEEFFNQFATFTIENKSTIENLLTYSIQLIDLLDTHPQAIIPQMVCRITYLCFLYGESNHKISVNKQIIKDLKSKLEVYLEKTREKRIRVERKLSRDFSKAKDDF